MILSNFIKYFNPKIKNVYIHSLFYSNIKAAFAMDVAYLRHVEGENEFHATFRFKIADIGVDKQLNFCRKLDESCGVFLNRVNSNVVKLFEKKSKKKNASPNVPDSKEVKSLLFYNGVPVPNETPCLKMFESVDGYSISVLDKQWKIAVNAPWIDSIVLPKVLMVGFPVSPNKFLAFFTDKTASIWIWYRSTTKGGPWNECGRGVSYTANGSDIGHFLRVVCHPKDRNGREGPPAEGISSTTVEAGPGYLPFEARHQFTKVRIDHTGFRIVSYNILADLYVDSEYSKTQLFGYCPTYALELDYRKQLLMKELSGYNADILCLQEVDSKVFRHHLKPMFRTAGLSGIYSQKGGTVSEGGAIFYADQKFQLLKSWRIVLSEALQSESILSGLWEKIKDKEPFASRFIQRSTSLQVVALRSIANPSQLLLVANTHLYFHPDADHVRLMQAVTATRYLENLLAEIKQEYLGCNTSLILCGDFNSTPECGIYKLLTSGVVEGDNVDWKSNVNEPVENVSYSHPLKMASACGTPEYTNYTPGFKACIDYIFYQTDHLHVKQVVPFPSEEELSTHSGIPSVVFPSDHIALVTDIHWNVRSIKDKHNNLRVETEEVLEVWREHYGEKFKQEQIPGSIMQTLLVRERTKGESSQQDEEEEEDIIKEWEVEDAIHHMKNIINIQ